MAVSGTIKYDAKSGSGAPANQTHYSDTASTLSVLAPYRKGYYFKGWSLSRAAMEPEYASGASYTNADITEGQVITFYAVYGRGRKCEVSVPSGQAVDSIYVNVPNGQAFDGLYCTVNNQVLSSSEGDALTDSDGNVLMVWE